MTSIIQRVSRYRPFWQAFGTGLVLSLVLIVIVFEEVEGRNPYAYNLPIYTLVYLIPWGILLFIPTVTGILSAAVTINYAQQETYTLLHMSNFSNRQLFTLCLKHAHQRAAPLIAFLIGLIPLHISSAMYPDITACSNICISIWYYGSATADALGFLPELVQFGLLIALMTVTGICLALWRRDKAQAIGGATIAGLVMMVADLRFDVLLQNTLYHRRSSFGNQSSVVFIPGQIELWVLFVVLIFVMSFLAIHWARKPE